MYYKVRQHLSKFETIDYAGGILTRKWDLNWWNWWKDKEAENKWNRSGL